MENELDSLCANTLAESVVELSLNSPFERDYSSVYAAADPQTWGRPSQSAAWLDHTKTGRAIQIQLELELELERWNDLLMRGHRDYSGPRKSDSHLS